MGRGCHSCFPAGSLTGGGGVGVARLPAWELLLPVIAGAQHAPWQGGRPRSSHLCLVLERAGLVREGCARPHGPASLYSRTCRPPSWGRRRKPLLPALDSDSVCRTSVPDVFRTQLLLWAPWQWGFAASDTDAEASGPKKWCTLELLGGGVVVLTLNLKGQAAVLVPPLPHL